MRQLSVGGTHHDREATDRRREIYVNTHHHWKSGRRSRSGRGRQHHHHHVLIENTGEYRHGKWQAHSDATTHFVEAKFELGENTAATLHRGDAVIIVGREHTSSWGEEGAKQYGHVLEAENIGVDLNRATAEVHRASQSDGTP